MCCPSRLRIRIAGMRPTTPLALPLLELLAALRLGLTQSLSVTHKSVIPWMISRSGKVKSCYSKIISRANRTSSEMRPDFPWCFGRDQVVLCQLKDVACLPSLKTLGSETEVSSTALQRVDLVSTCMWAVVVMWTRPWMMHGSAATCIYSLLLCQHMYGISIYSHSSIDNLRFLHHLT